MFATDSPTTRRYGTWPSPFEVDVLAQEVVIRLNHDHETTYPSTSRRSDLRTFSSTQPRLRYSTLKFVRLKAVMFSSVPRSPSMLSLRNMILGSQYWPFLSLGLNEPPCRSVVNGLGGRAATARDGVIFFNDGKDSRIYKENLGTITPVTKGLTI